MNFIYRATIILFGFILLSFRGFAEKDTIVIRGEVSDNIRTNFITLWFYDDLLEVYNPQLKLYEKKVLIKDGKFEIKIHSNQMLAYLNFGLKEAHQGSMEIQTPYHFIAETNDEVFLRIDSIPTGYDFKFLGPSGPKYQLVKELNELQKQFTPQIEKARNLSVSDEIAYSISIFKEIVKLQLDRVEGYKATISRNVSDLLKLDIVHNNLFYQSRFLIFSNEVSKSSKDKQTLLQEFQLLKKFSEELASDIDSNVLGRSVQLPNSIYTLSRLESLITREPLIQILKNIPLQHLRDRVLTYYFIDTQAIISVSDKQELFNNLLASVTDDYCIETLHKYFNLGEFGKQAYNFSLPDFNGKIRTLSEFKGKVVFVDFWFVGCGACSKFYRDVLKHVEAKYRNSPNVVFVTISIDTDVKLWKNGIIGGAYTSTEVVNLHCPDGIKNGVIQELSVVGYPFPILIDREGKIFSNSSNDLRFKGIEGLTNMIEKAIAN